MSRWRIAIALVAATAGWACTAQTPPLPDPRVVEEELMEADREFSRQTTSRGVDGWVEAFAPHGKLFGPGPILEGHDAIRQAMAGIGEEGNTLVWEPVYAEAGPSGDFGYTHGTYRRERTDPDGNVHVETGKYVSVWRRDDTGRFRVVIDTGHPDPPPRLPLSEERQSMKSREDRRERVERHVAAYREHPETEEDVATAHALAAMALTEVPWRVNRLDRDDSQISSG